MVGGPIAIGASDVDASKQVVFKDVLISLLSAFKAARGFPPCQLAEAGL